MANALQPGLWVSEREKLSTKATAFFKDRIEREVDLRNTILGKFQLSRDDNEEEKYLQEKVHQIIGSRVGELQEILSKSDNLTPETRLRLEVELKFLCLKDLYLGEREKIVDALINNNH